MGFEDEILEEMADSYARQIEENDTECPEDGCTSTDLDIEIWITSSGRFDGEGRCMSCNSRFELDIEDSDARDAVDDVTDAFEDLQDTLDDF